MMTLRKLKARYNELRRRHFMNPPPGRHLPPLASELRWAIDRHTYWFASVVFDEDGDPEILSINEVLLHGWMDYERDRILAHELTHMRLGPGSKCTTDTKARIPKAWKEEQMRLSAEGFPWL